MRWHACGQECRCSVVADSNTSCACNARRLREVARRPPAVVRRPREVGIARRGTLRPGVPTAVWTASDTSTTGRCRRQCLEGWPSFSLGRELGVDKLEGDDNLGRRGPLGEVCVPGGGQEFAESIGPTLHELRAISIDDHLLLGVDRFDLSGNRGERRDSNGGGGTQSLPSLRSCSWSSRWLEIQHSCGKFCKKTLCLYCIRCLPASEYFDV